MNNATPVEASKRHMVLDTLRGFALLGVCMANYPEFSLYSFLSSQEQAAMPTAEADNIVHWLMLTLIDGKFYTLFSLLFGIGFSIIIANAQAKGANGMRIFYRRMLILLLIGFAHLMLVWSGDILMLYAALGMLLPLVSKWSDRRLLTVAAVLLALPMAVDGVAEALGVELGASLLELEWHFCGCFGITEENFATWLRDAESYSGVSAFLVQGAFERMWEFVVGNRYFKVMGLFMLGFYIGRHRLYADLETNASLFKKVARWGFLCGLPMSLVYAWSSINGRPLGNALHTVFYTLSVYPMGLAYAASLALLFRKCPNFGLWKTLAAPGRMAMTCYLCQSLLGMLIFYGTGFGLGTSLGLWQTELVALGVFAFEAAVCHAWLRGMNYGPFEWVWRMLTYGKWLRIRKK